MSGRNEFLFDDEGMVREQRYRIDAAIENESNRRASFYPGDPNSAVSMRQATHASTSGAAMLANSNMTGLAASNAGNTNMAFDGTLTQTGLGGTRGGVSVRQLTKLEQRRMDTIKDRQQSNLVQKQVVGGKEYKGCGFLAEPKVIEFIDFEVGQVYKVKVQITNVSQTFNAFKVCDMPANVRDLFDVIWTPQSMMSAGMCTTIVIAFSPKEDTDIDTYVPLLAQTGGINIPVVCRRRRVVASLSTNLIDFGAIVVAEEVEETLEIKNDGALASKMEIGGEFLDMLSVTQKDSRGKDVHVWETFPELNQDKANRMTLQPFSTTKLTIRFKPMQVSEFDTSIFISFDNPEAEDKVLFVKGAAVDVPVFVDHNAVLNFQCCYYGTLYRDKVVIRNTTKSAVRVQPTVPVSLKDVLEYVPKFGFVQPDGARFEFQVKFTPTKELGDEVDTAVKINVADQVMPIFYRIKASLTRRELILDPPYLQYGMCVMQEALRQKMKVTNNSRLPITFGFTKIPTNINVGPSNILTLAPMESLDVDVAVQPTHLGAFSQQLTLKTEHDETTYIPVTGHGKPSTFSLAPSVAKFPKVCIGGSVSVTTILTNTTNQLQKFRFKSNPNYGLVISPESGELQKKESMLVVVTFNPTQQCVDPIIPPEVDDSDEAANAAAEAAAAARPPSKNAKKKSKAEEEAERKEKERLEEERKAKIAAAKAERERIMKEVEAMEPWEQNAEGEPWSRHRTLNIPCFIENWSCAAVFLQLRCTVVEPSIIPKLLKAATGGHQQQQQPQSAATSRPPSGALTGRSQASRTSVTIDPAAMDPASAIPQQLQVNRSAGIEIDFGDVPAQHAVTRTVTLTNNSEQPSHISVKPLDPFGPFCVTRPPTNPLMPGNETEVVLQFTPKAKAVYLETVVLQATNANDIFLNCLGEGLPATLAIAQKKEELAEASSHAEMDVDMGHCLTGDKAEVPLFFENLSPFPLRIQTRFESSTVTNFNPNATIPFSLHPHTFTIPANGKTEAVASFTPGAEAAFDASATIEFGGEGSIKTLNFSGFGWEKGVYVQFPLGEHETQTLDAKRRDVLSMFGDALEPLGSASNPHVISFVSREQATVSAAIAIGNNKGSSGGDYTIEGLTDVDTKNGWKIDSLKANVAPGTRNVVNVTFTPTQQLLDSLPLVGVGVVTVCNIKLLVKGGAPAVDQTYYVKLKGSAWQ